MTILTEINGNDLYYWQEVAITHWWNDIPRDQWLSNSVELTSGKTRDLISALTVFFFKKIIYLFPSFLSIFPQLEMFIYNCKIL
jgi:hypothetical protein